VKINKNTMLASATAAARADRAGRSMKTSDLCEGDTVRNDAMVLLLDSPTHRTNHPVTEHGGTTYAVDALVVNFDELVANAEAGDTHAGWLVSMIRSDWKHKDANGRAHDGQPRWTIQGNDLARWLVIA
jgi:hypothetical protein